MSDLPGPQLRALKARAQLLEPILKLGKAGLSDSFFAALDIALDQHELVKLKFEAFKDQKKTLTPQIVERSHSQLILRVGNVLVLYRRNPAKSAPDHAADFRNLMADARSR